jgi:hypothetical protein
MKRRRGNSRNIRVYCLTWKRRHHFQKTLFQLVHKAQIYPCKTKIIFKVDRFHSPFASHSLRWSIVWNNVGIIISKRKKMELGEELVPMLLCPLPIQYNVTWDWIRGPTLRSWAMALYIIEEKKFWKEIIAYFYFTTYWVFDMICTS